MAYSAAVRLSSVLEVVLLLEEEEEPAKGNLIPVAGWFREGTLGSGKRSGAGRKSVDRAWQKTMEWEQSGRSRSGERAESS